MLTFTSQRGWFASLSVLYLSGIALVDMLVQDQALQACPRRRYAVATLIEEKAPPPAKSPSSEDQKKLQALLTERRDVLKEAFEARWGRVKLGLDAPNADLLDLSLLSLQAELELFGKSDDRIAAHEKFVTVAKKIDDVYERWSKDGRIRGDVYRQVHAARLAAEIELLREKAGGKPTEEQTAAIKKLLESRRDALREEIEAKEARIKGGLESFPNVLMDASGRLMLAELDLTEAAKDRIAAHEKFVTVAKKIDDLYERMSKDKRIRGDEYSQVHAARLAGEIGLLREKAGGKPSADQIAETKKLLETRRDALREVVDAKQARIKGGLEGPDVYLMDASPRLLQAELELTEKPADRIALHQKYVEIAKKTEETFKGAAKNGRIRDEVYLEVKAVRLGAEIALLREQMK
jgi:hypothetical protein